MSESPVIIHEGVLEGSHEVERVSLHGQHVRVVLLIVALDQVVGLTKGLSGQDHKKNKKNEGQE